MAALPDRMTSVEDLEESLSKPTAGVLDTLRNLKGDVMVLGAGGKMGPTLARMVRRGFEALGQPDRNVIAVSRFSSTRAKQTLQAHGVQTIGCDLLDPAAVAQLPKVPNIIFMAGQKFGTVDSPEVTWAMNTLVPAQVAQQFHQSRIVVFSTGCVYPMVSTQSCGSNENDLLGPMGDYSNSCVGRERIFTYFAKKLGTPMLMYRLSYAIDLRYGVLADIATRVYRGEPVDVTMPAANIIWQGDANARAIQCLLRTTNPPDALNVTGLQPVRVRDLAIRFGKLFGVAPILAGSEANTAWLFDAGKSYQWFGPPEVDIDQMINLTYHWVRQGGESLGKPTHFEVRDGNY
jgi:nucleoside-diphosphate-sugar epimerase